MKKWKKILLSLFFVGIASAGIILYLATKKPATAEDSKPIAEFSAVNFISKLDSSHQIISARYMDKNISIEGNIKEVNAAQYSLVFDGGADAIITCTFDSAIFSKNSNQFIVGKSTKVKGIYFGCDGFEKTESDDLMDLLPQQKTAMLKTCAVHE
jgi:hypothetical protein